MRGVCDSLPTLGLFVSRAVRGIPNFGSEVFGRRVSVAQRSGDSVFLMAFASCLRGRTWISSLRSQDRRTAVHTRSRGGCGGVYTRGRAPQEGGPCRGLPPSTSARSAANSRIKPEIHLAPGRARPQEERAHTRYQLWGWCVQPLPRILYHPYWGDPAGTHLDNHVHGPAQTLRANRRFTARSDVR